MPQKRFDQRENADRNIGFLMNDAARLMRTTYDRKMRRLGLTRSQWWVMTFLYFNEGISQTELSALLDIERATLASSCSRPAIVVPPGDVTWSLRAAGWLPVSRASRVAPRTVWQASWWAAARGPE